MLDIIGLLLLLMLTLSESYADSFDVDGIVAWTNFQAMRFQQIRAFDVWIWILVRVGSKIYKYHQLPVIDTLDHDHLMCFRDYMMPSPSRTQKMDGLVAFPMKSKAEKNEKYSIKPKQENKVNRKTNSTEQHLECYALHRILMCSRVNIRILLKK